MVARIAEEAFRKARVNVSIEHTWRDIPKGRIVIRSQNLDFRGAVEGVPS